MTRIRLRVIVPVIAACGIAALALSGCSASVSVGLPPSTPSASDTSDGGLTAVAIVQTMGVDAGTIFDGDLQFAAIEALKQQFPTIDTQANFGLECPTMPAEVGASQVCPLTSGASDTDVFDTSVTVTAVDGDKATISVVVADPTALEAAQA
ncbi:MAG: hypothetical protein PHU75_11155 [Candidatus Nanopelagicales bacterium]|nr:hypothetical protein [Candidatus Nanopelagicales bacterium]